MKRFLSAYLPWIIFALVVTVLGFWFFTPAEKKVTYRITAGDFLSSRHRVASVLGELTKKEKITFDFVATDGSQTALDMLTRGELDLALIQGGLPAPENVELVALIYPEPLHILVRPEMLDAGIAGLRGKTLNLSTEGSGTRLLSLQVLDFAEIYPDDYKTTAYSYEELLELPDDQLPDALFMVQSMPSKIVGELVRDKGYTLLPVRFGESLRYRDISILQTAIPEEMYSVSRKIPAEDLPAVGTYLTLVTRSDVEPEGIARLLTVIFDNEFARKAKIPNLSEEHLEIYTPYALHLGARQFLSRDEPFLRGDFIEGLENARSFFFSIVIAIFLLRTWIVQQRSHSFEPFLERITKIERELLESETGKTLCKERLKVLRKELSIVKSEVVERYVEGKLSGIELMTGFFAHANDVRDYLHSLQSELPDDENT